MSTAERIARKAHEGQTDKSGRPYIEHVERVVAAVEASAKDVAWLHDVLEDTPLTHQDLLEAGIEPHIVEAVYLLTREDEVYAEYIESIRASKNLIAIAVKVADLRDHLRTHIPDSLRVRYKRALKRLI